MRSGPARLPLLLLLPTLLLTARSAPGQVEIPKKSPAASVSQVVGTTRITLDYHRPGVKGRVIWGELVPYDQVWRLGANEATKLTVSDPVEIAGSVVPAGSYAFFAIPGKQSWTLILNKQWEQWGALKYQESEDQLRFTVKPEAAPFTEWQTFSLTPLDGTSAELELRWEKLALRFPIRVDVKGIVWARIDEAVAKEPQNDAVLLRAARFSLDTQERLPEGLAWAERASTIKESNWTVDATARLLWALGRKAEAEKALRKARELGKDMPAEYLKGVDKTLAEWQAAK